MEQCYVILRVKSTYIMSPAQIRLMGKAVVAIFTTGLLVFLLFFFLRASANAARLFG